jgi:hypothetical protein
MSDLLIESAKEIESLRKKVAELDKVVVHQDECYAGLERQLAAMTQERDEARHCSDDYQYAAETAGKQLASAQARIKELRDFAIWMSGHDIFGSLQYFIDNRHILATPDDSSALDAALKAERERCADEMWQAYLDGEESYSKLHDAIRSLK